ncbi:MAG: hypothetical protein EXS55_00605 [Candidatus Magasanikbacteria bacterium]|nr:hypothetical protein [Candidatus Magasanikbacteria bacterium]
MNNKERWFIIVYWKKNGEKGKGFKVSLDYGDSEERIRADHEAGKGPDSVILLFLDMPLPEDEDARQLVTALLKLSAGTNDASLDGWIAAMLEHMIAHTVSQSFFKQAMKLMRE